MKKGTKIALLLAAVLIVAGCAVVGAAAAAAGGFDAMAHRAYDNYYTERAYDCAPDGITSVKLGERNAAVELAASEDGYIHVIYRENSHTAYTIEEKNGELRIACEREGNGEDREPRWSDWLYFSTSLSFGRTLRIELPERFSGSVSLETTNGQIDASSLSLASLSVETNNGSVALDDISADSAVSVSTSNGHVWLEDISARAISAQTHNSSIEFGGISAAESISFETSNGSIRGSLSGRADMYSIESRTSNGASNLPKHTEGGGVSLRAVTSNGQIDVEFDD